MLADKGYDTRQIFKEIKIVSGIMPRKGSKARGGGGARDDVVKALRNMGKRRYKWKIDY